MGAHIQMRNMALNRISRITIKSVVSFRRREGWPVSGIEYNTFPVLFLPSLSVMDARFVGV